MRVFLLFLLVTVWSQATQNTYRQRLAAIQATKSTSLFFSKFDCATSTCATNQSIDSIMDFLHGTRRATFAGSKLAASILQDDTQNYGQALSVIVVVIFSIGLILSIAGCVGCGVKWGGDHCARGTCGKDDNVILKWIPLVFVILFTAVIVVMLVLSWINDTPLHNAVNQVRDSILNASVVEAARYNSVAVTLETADPNQGAQVLGVTGWNSIRDTVTDDATTTVSWAGRSESGRRGFLIAVAIIVLIVLTLGIIAVIFRIKPLLKAAPELGWFCIVLLWLVIAVHMALSTGAADVCHDTFNTYASVDALLNANSSSFYNVVPPAGKILNCIGIDTVNLFFNNSNTMRSNINANSTQNAYIDDAQALAAELYSCLYAAEVLVSNQQQTCSEIQPRTYAISIYALIASIFFIGWTVPVILVWKRVSFDKAAAGAGAGVV